MGSSAFRFFASAANDDRERHPPGRELLPFAIQPFPGPNAAIGGY